MDSLKQLIDEATALFSANRGLAEDLEKERRPEVRNEILVNFSKNSERIGEIGREIDKIRRATASRE